MAAQDITERLVAVRNGDSEALQQIFEIVYKKLHRMARRELARPFPSTLSSATLVDEAYAKLVDRTRVDWKDRRHFFSVAARAMRQILVDHVEARGQEGAGARHVSLSET